MREATSMQVPALEPAIDRRDPEARAIYVVLGALGLVRVIVALALGESFGGEDTVAVAMVVAAIVGGLGSFERRPFDSALARARATLRANGEGSAGA